jgi:hypothetical protein
MISPFVRLSRAEEGKAANSFARKPAGAEEGAGRSVRAGAAIFQREKVAVGLFRIQHALHGGPRQQARAMGMQRRGLRRNLQRSMRVLQGRDGGDVRDAEALVRVPAAPDLSGVEPRIALVQTRLHFGLEIQVALFGGRSAANTMRFKIAMTSSSNQ